MKPGEVLRVFKNVFVKRKYKDSLFRFVFREPQEILQLYNAINHTNYANPDDLVITTMEDVIYIGMKNDLSFLIANELNLYEHQSTLNKNMPLRGLLYLAKMYESYIETHKLNRYQKHLIKLPFPRFIIFYNGEDNIEEEVYLRLSDAFDNQGEEPAVDCVAKIVNINYGRNQELMAGCKRLHDYSYLVECVRRYLQKGFGHKEAVIRATDECIDKGILEDILVKHRSEVVDMFLTTFDKKMYAEALREEGREEMAKKYAELSKNHEELSKEYLEFARNCAEYLFEKGVPMEAARKLVTQLSEEELKDIYRMK